MAITTYNDLQNAVTNWLARSDLASHVPTFISLGEVRVNRHLRCREMETALSSSMAGGVIAVPSDYLELKHAYVSGAPVVKLLRMSASQLYEKYPLRSADAKPKFIARDGSNFVFGPYPNSDYTVTGVYYAKPSPLSDSAHTTFVAHPDVYLFAALAESAPFLKDDPRVALWEQKLASVIADVNRLTSYEYASGGGMAVMVE